MVINTNIHAIQGARNLQGSQEMLGKSLARLSSGSKIVSPSDDAAGLAVSEKMDAQRARVGAAFNNVQNAISMVQTMDGFLKTMSNMLTRMSELTTLAQDVTKNSDDVALYNQEFEALKDQLRSTIGGTEYGFAADQQPLGTFNGISLFGTATTFNVTIGEGVGQNMTLNNIDLRSTSGTGTFDGSIRALLSTSTVGGQTDLGVDATNARSAVVNAIQELATKRAELGASQSRLEIATENLSIQRENLDAAISRIRDVDIATETAEYSKYQILVQSGTAMLAQANQLPQSVLRLLG